MDRGRNVRKMGMIKKKIITCILVMLIIPVLTGTRGRSYHYKEMIRPAGEYDIHISHIDTYKIPIPGVIFFQPVHLPDLHGPVYNPRISNKLLLFQYNRSILHRYRVQVALSYDISSDPHPLFRQTYYTEKANDPFC